MKAAGLMRLTFQVWKYRGCRGRGRSGNPGRPCHALCTGRSSREQSRASRRAVFEAAVAIADGP